MTEVDHGSTVQQAGEGTASSSRNKNTFTADEVGQIPYSSVTSLRYVTAERHASIQLRNLFTLHEDVACQTHDLLGCRCHLGEACPEEGDADGSEEDEDDDNSDSSGDEYGGGFVQASQYQDKDVKRAVRLGSLPQLHQHSAGN